MITETLLLFLLNTSPVTVNTDSLLKIQCSKFNVLDRKITSGSIDRDEASEKLKRLKFKIESLYDKLYENKKTGTENRWSFPLRNYTSVYYRDYGNDFRRAGYDYFQGSDSKGHPAHDIMILDSNKDLLDDSTLKPVDVVSMCDGIVVATDNTWEPGSDLRGGMYVKVFDVSGDGMFYYSHLSAVDVYPGQHVTAGEKIGEVGRTGRKAILPQGKTHLHVAYLKFVDGYPIPVDIIGELRKSEKN